MVNLAKKISNCIRAYVMGDALGVPFEFQKQGTFNCTNFTGNGTYNKPVGTWSDDTSVLLCWLNAIIYYHDNNLVNQFKNNLKQWYYKGDFTIDGLFDIGNQTANAIKNDFPLIETSSMGNGALFHALPTVLYALIKGDYSDSFIKEHYKEFCSLTHSNKNCFEIGSHFCLIILNLLLDLPQQPFELKEVQNKGDVISTFYTVVKEFSLKKDNSGSLKEDLCEIVNKGEDTDTNAAFLGLLLGMTKPVDDKDWKLVRGRDYVDFYINLLLNKLGLNDLR